MSEDEIRTGLSVGRVLIQEGWADPSEVAIVDKLIAEGFAVVTRDWQWSANAQTELRYVKRRQP